MKQEDIDKGNLIIADFMVWEEQPAIVRSAITGKPTVLHYHRLWNWLMPVVEKIESMNDSIVTKVWITINGLHCDIYNYFITKEVLRKVSYSGNIRIRKVAPSKIEATWQACVEFIVWYNEQSKKSEK